MKNNKSYSAKIIGPTKIYDSRGNPCDVSSYEGPVDGIVDFWDRILFKNMRVFKSVRDYYFFVLDSNKMDKEDISNLALMFQIYEELGTPKEDFYKDSDLGYCLISRDIITQSKNVRRLKQ